MSLYLSSGTTKFKRNNMTAFYIMAILFVIGVILIALEDIVKINKAAVAVGMCILLWLLTILSAGGVFTEHLPHFFNNFIAGFPKFASLSFPDQVTRFLEVAITESLGDVATTLFFVLASMAIIEVLDSHGSFSVITRMIKSNSKRKLLWIFSFITFFMSALLGNLATVIVMIAVINKIVPEKKDTLIYACMTIVSANAGGSWSPIGDVTTLLLWTGGNLSAVHQITHIIIPALAMMIVPLGISTFMFKKGENINERPALSGNTLPEYITPRFQTTLLTIGMLSLVLVPVLQSLFELPPFMGVLLGLVVLWIITDLKSARSNDPEALRLKVSTLFGKLDISTIFFFLGILMSVKALDTIGILTVMSEGLNTLFSDNRAIAFLLGVCSSFLDNVALVAATMGMYPLAEVGAYMTDSSFWTLLAYCCVTGGSILIIGSAAGVTVMGIEKISFGYYLKKFTPIIFLGYVIGALILMLFI